jgi:hypothetical protein
VGTASVYLGSATGLAATPARVLAGGAAGDYFGGAVAGAGDVNGDGVADVVVGAPYADPGGRSSAGTASVYHGSATGLAATPARVYEGGARDDQFGWSVASADDAHGDGDADIAIGAPATTPGGLAATPAPAVDGARPAIRSAGRSRPQRSSATAASPSERRRTGAREA